MGNGSPYNSGIGIPIMLIIITFLLIGGFITIGVLSGISMFYLSSISTTIITNNNNNNSCPSAAAGDVLDLLLDSDNCNDDNNCTVDFNTSIGTCIHHSTFNNIPCDHECYVNGTCFNGECGGSCIGNCNASTECPIIHVYNWTSVPFFGSGGDALGLWTGCAINTCWYAMQIIYTDTNTFLGFTNDIKQYLGGSVLSFNITGWAYTWTWQNPLSRLADKYPWDDPMSKMCMSFIDDADRGCLQAHMSFFNSDPQETNIRCEYTYKCSDPLELPIDSLIEFPLKLE